jgi:hypothetical protein
LSLVVNLDEFSELCGVSSETMRKYFRELEEAPVWMLKRGTKGSGYEIEPLGGVAWWKARRDADDMASAERLAQLQQLRFELLGDAAESEDALGLSGKQRREEYVAEWERLRLRRALGELVEVSAIMPLLMSAAVEARRRLMLVPGEFAALTGMTPEEVKPLEGLIERAVEEFVTTFTAPRPSTSSG